jgi:hypothetical protein
MRGELSARSRPAKFSVEVKLHRTDYSWQLTEIKDSTLPKNPFPHLIPSFVVGTINKHSHSTFINSFSYSTVTVATPVTEKKPNAIIFESGAIVSL